MTTLNDFIIEPPTPLQSSLLNGFVGFDEYSLFKTASPEHLSNAPTIFFDIAKTCLIEEIIKQRNDLNIKMESILSCLSFNMEKLSQEKKLLDKLVVNIRDLKLGESDEQSYRRLESLIYESEQSNRRMFLSAGYDHRNFDRLEKVISILHKLYGKLKETELLNIPNDEDPFNCYCFHVASYFAMGIMKMLGTSHEQKFSLKSLEEEYFVGERERLVLKSLKTCDEGLKTIGTTFEPAAKKRIVLASLERLEKENNSLINNHRLPSITGFPGFFSFSSLSMLPTEPGALQQCINQAKRELDSEDMEASAAYSL